MGIALRILSSAFVFALHAILPFIHIKRRLDLEATSAFLGERNQFIEAAATATGSRSAHVSQVTKPDRHNTPALA
jgi:hypothetical protein